VRAQGVLLLQKEIMVQAWNVDGESVMPVASHLTLCGCSLTGAISDYLSLSEINMHIHENCPSRIPLAIINLKENSARTTRRYLTPLTTLHFDSAVSYGSRTEKKTGGGGLGGGGANTQTVV
jgi:hypothetical protein